MGYNMVSTGLLGQGQVAAGSGTDWAGTCGRERKKKRKVRKKMSKSPKKGVP